MLVKLLYDSGFNFNHLIYAYASLFVISWLKCIFLTPRQFENKKLSSFELSVVGKCLSKESEKVETNSVVSKSGKPIEELKDVIHKSVLSVPYASFVVFISIITTRCSSIPAWIHPWLEWTFYDRDRVISVCFFLFIILH